jgi:acetolactate synthase-1/3 small subunit
VTELSPGDAVERELLLLRVSAGPERRAELITTADAFRGRVVDLGPDAILFELVGTPEELDAFQELARPHGIQELVRTGRVGMSRASARRQGRRLSAIN